MWIVTAWEFITVLTLSSNQAIIVYFSKYIKVITDYGYKTLAGKAGRAVRTKKRLLEVAVLL